MATRQKLSQIFLLILILIRFLILIPSLLFNSKKPRKKPLPYPSPRVALRGLMANSPVSEPQPTLNMLQKHMVFAQSSKSLFQAPQPTPEML